MNRSRSCGGVGGSGGCICNCCLEATDKDSAAGLGQANESTAGDHGVHWLVAGLLHPRERLDVPPEDHVYMVKVTCTWLR